MKIQSAQHMANVARVGQGGERAGRESSAKGQVGDRVSLSSDAAFVQSLRHEAREEQGIRSDLVNETRAALEDGSLESSIDMDRVLDALLADL